VRLVPTLARRVAECPAPSATERDAERYLTFGAVAALLTRAAQWSPLVLVLDDLHWADKASLLLLRYLAERLEVAPVLVLGSYRSSELTSEHPLNDVLPMLHRSTELAEVELRGLAAGDVAALARAAAGPAFDHDDERLAHAIRRETAGNPFFVLEIFRHLAEAGADAPGAGRVPAGTAAMAGAADAGAPAGALTLPPSVRAVVAQRVARLGTGTARLLSVAAVLGASFDLDLVQAVLDTDAGDGAGGEEDLLESVERAVGAALVVEQEGAGGRFAFAHSLVQATLYSDLSAARCARVHRRAAQVLEERTDLDAATKIRALAHHWDRAGDDAQALRYAQQAGQLALEGLAPDEAVRWFDRALHIQETHRPGDTALRSELLILVGTAQRMGGDPAYRRTLLDAGALARVIGDGQRMAEAALACYRGFWSSAGQVDEQKVDALEVALAYLGRDDDATRARMLATLANELSFVAPLERRRALVDEALGLAGLMGDPATLVPVLTSSSDAIWVPDSVDERLVKSALAVELAEELDDPVATFYATNFRLQAVTALGRIDEADECLATMQRISDDIGQPTLRWISAFAHACRALLAGDPDEAERLNDLALALGSETGQPDALVFYGAALTYVRWQQGRMGEIVPLLWQAARDNPGIPGYWGSVAWALAETGDSSEASRLLDEAADEGFAHLHDDSLRLPGLVMYAEAAIRLGAQPAAELLYDVLAPYRDQLSYMGVGVDGPVDHYLGALAAVLDRHDAAQEHFEGASETARAIGAQFFLARTQLEWGRALASRRGPGDERLAATLSSESRALAVERGYVVVAQRAGALAARLSG
jgi:tetratricopeptide (TPR) repeat protein